MIFPTLSASLLGFATLAVAAPQLHSRFERAALVARLPVEAVERGIFPRGRRNNNEVQDITLTQTQVNQEISTNGFQTTEIDLVKEVQQRIIVVDNSRQLRDNVRRNTFNARNNNVNTVVLVVTQVLDQRDSNNVNTRYMTRQIESNSNNQQQVFVVISESQTMTIGGSNSNGRQNADATGSGFAAQSTGSVQQFTNYDPSALAALSNNVQTLSNGQQIIGQQILPIGSVAPTWSNAQNSQDPAIILDEKPSQEVFVSFQQQDQGQSSNAAILLAIATLS